MPIKQSPSLFGLEHSNRDFSNAESWGKNQFNSSFPASLCCYLFSKGMNANYYVYKQGRIAVDCISISDAFKISPESSSIYFAFEAPFMPFQKYVTGTLPRTDMIVQNSVTGECLSCFEIKLTALPDNTTCSLSENLYGSEIVIRPDTIVYLACSLASKLNKGVLAELKQSVYIDDWTEPASVVGNLDKIIQQLNNIVLQLEKIQTPFLLQPVWKTIGKSPKLA